ncbi:MAG: response regulator [Alphaproteobacteria bacterium]|nr:response regulator [Alphaproteobacteria bacterium]
MTAARLTRIMLVDDEPDIRTVAKLALEMLGSYTVKDCASGDTALSEIKSFAPQIILLDVMMPNMDGPTTLRALRALPEAKDVPAIFMTAKVQPQEVEQYLSMGAVAVISKPFDPMTLSAQVENAWKQTGGA